MNDWSARQYLKFEDDRTRPSRDLLAQVPLDHAERVFDLGCGPGNSTELLIERFPEAEVIGLDSSSDMLRQARERLPGRTFVHGDLTTWNPPEGTDLLFANAVFQWVSDHPAVLARLLNALPSSGVLAVQMPDNTNEPALALMRQVTPIGKCETCGFATILKSFASLCCTSSFWKSISKSVRAMQLQLVAFKNSKNCLRKLLRGQYT
jgi:trans-aconitate 2-methyltransferase